MTKEQRSAVIRVILASALGFAQALSLMVAGWIAATIIQQGKDVAIVKTQNAALQTSVTEIKADLKDLAREVHARP